MRVIKVLLWIFIIISAIPIVTSFMHKVYLHFHPEIQTCMNCISNPTQTDQVFIPVRSLLCITFVSLASAILLSLSPQKRGDKPLRKIEKVMHRICTLSIRLSVVISLISFYYFFKHGNSPRFHTPFILINPFIQTLLGVCCLSILSTMVLKICKHKNTTLPRMVAISSYFIMFIYVMISHLILPHL